MKTGRLVCPFLRVTGPAKSTPVTEKGGAQMTLSSGKSAMYWGSGLGAAFLQVMH